MQIPFRSQPVNFVARTNSLKFHYFRSNMFPSSVYTNINRIADNTLFEITDTDSNGFNLSVSQNSKSRIFNPVSPISLKLHLHKDTSESSIFEALEKVVEVCFNFVRNVYSFVYLFALLNNMTESAKFGRSM